MPVPHIGARHFHLHSGPAISFSEFQLLAPAGNASLGSRAFGASLPVLSACRAALVGASALLSCLPQLRGRPPPPPLPPTGTQWSSFSCVPFPPRRRCLPPHPCALAVPWRANDTLHSSTSLARQPLHHTPSPSCDCGFQPRQVGGVQSNTPRADVEALFRKFGEVTDVHTGFPGILFVTMTDQGWGRLPATRARVPVAVWCAVAVVRVRAPRAIKIARAQGRRESDRAA